MRVSTVLAHADDAELWAGGTLLKHSHLGDSLSILTFAEVGGVRQAEAMEGAQLLGAECRVEDRRLLGSRDLCASISAFLDITRPDILITHWDRDTHPEHVAVSKAVQIATVPTRIERGVPSILLACDTYGSMGTDEIFHPSLYIDITAVFEKKLAAIAAHRSQPVEHWESMARTLGALHGTRSGCRYAEAFREVPILGQMHCVGTLPSPHRPDLAE